MTKTESLDVRVLRWGGFAMAAFLAATMVGGMARAENEDHRGPGGHGGRHQPPPAAFDACKGKKAADTCEVTFGEQKVAGSCTSRDEGPLFCRPARRPGPPPAAFDACNGKQDGDTCSVTFDGQTRQGQCRTGHSDRLACRPQHN
jgi:hypothetical protein